MLKEEFLFAGKYKLKKLLGRGGFSEVWLAVDTMTNVEVAVKVYAAQARLEEEGIEIFKKEFALVFGLNHTNLLHPTYFDVWEDMPYLILPYCKEGSVFKFISKRIRITEEQCWNLMHDVAAGLCYMHERTPPLIHQDIKPDNILISDEGHYMITDFGISTKVRNTIATMQNASSMSSGTLAYMGPERFSTKPKPLMASDIWSLGAMMYELMTAGNPPFGNHGGALQKNGADIPEIEEKEYSDQLKEIIYWCMAPNTWDRPTARNIEEITYKKLHGIDITKDLSKHKGNQQKPKQTQLQQDLRPTTIAGWHKTDNGVNPQPRPSDSYAHQPRYSGNYGPQPRLSGSYEQQPRLSGSYERQPRLSGNYVPQPRPSGSIEQQPRPSGVFEQQPRPSGNYVPQPRPSGNYGGTHLDTSHLEHDVQPWYSNKKVLAVVAGVAIVAILLVIWLMTGSSNSKETQQDPQEISLGNSNLSNLYELQSNIRSLLSSGEALMTERISSKSLGNTQHGAIEDNFIKVLDIYDTLLNTPGYDSMGDNFKSGIEKDKVTAVEKLNTIHKKLQEEKEEYKKQFGEDATYKKYESRIKTIKERLKQM